MSLQIPDTRTGNDVIDAVVVDEEAVGYGAKILYGKGALNRYLSEHKEVCMHYLFGILNHFFVTIILIVKLNHACSCM